MFKFIHAADIHLDSPLRGLDKYEGAPVDAIRGATRRAFSKLVQLAIAERVDFVILAGDIYDGDWPDYNTGLFFVRELRELDNAGIRVVLLRGNHDAQSKITKSLKLPKNTQELSWEKPDTVKIDSLHVAIHGQGYSTQAEKKNLAAEYPPPISEYFNIGVLHTALDGRDGHAHYAPCTLEELLAREYDYWALGHVHNRKKKNGDNHPRVEFPGNIQGRDIDETGAKGCLLVTVDSHGRATPDFRALDVFRWAEVKVDASEAESVDVALDAAGSAIADARDQAEGRPLATRVEITCRDTIHRQLAGNLEQFRFDLAGQSATDIWIEKIKLALVREDERIDSTVMGDAASELRAVLAEVEANPAAFQEILAAGDCGKLGKALPSQIREVREPNDSSKVHNIFDANREDIFERAAMLLRGDGMAEEIE
jgi:DNA repair protein SbcD/Mre11